MTNEKDIERRLIKYCSQIGATVFKNEVGLAWTQNGCPIKFGLCKGSSDLIGITPVVITSDMVGCKIGVFTAIEVKQKGKKAREDQQRFIDFVKSNGGYSGVAVSEEDVSNILEKKNEVW